MTNETTGKVGVVVPYRVLFRGSREEKTRQKLIEINLLAAVIGLSANLFFGTSIPAAILLFNKQRKLARVGDKVLFIDVSHHYKSGKNQNKLREDQDSEDSGCLHKLYKGSAGSWNCS